MALLEVLRVLRGAIGMGIFLLSVTATLPVVVASVVRASVKIVWPGFSSWARRGVAAAAGCTAYVAMFTHPWVAWASWALFVALVPAGLVAASGLVVLNRVIPGVAMATRRILVSIVTLGIVGWLHVSTLDGLPGFTLGLVLGDDTEYAPHYSARGFRSVSLGMGEEEVRSLVGDPLRTWQDEEQSYWSWSRSPHDSHYRVRIVAFEHGAVVRKSSEFYLD